jgi:hypothetical protein
MTSRQGLPDRVLVGFIVVPPVAVTIALVTYDGFWHLGLLPNGAPIHSLDAAASLGLGLAIIVVPMTLLALAAVAWLIDRVELSLRTLVLLGAALGNVPFAIIITGIVLTQVTRDPLSLAGVASNWYGLSGAVIRIVLGAIVGTGSATVFWVVAVWSGWRR